VSKQRKGILPRLGIADAFFNKKVQKVLERRFQTPKLADNPSAQQEYLAWLEWSPKMVPGVMRVCDATRCHT
jgi:hypothetical protein